MRNIVIPLQVFGLLGDPFGDKIIDAARDVARRILLQTRNDQILLIDDTPIVQALLTVEDLHQRGFTRAVTAHQTDAFVVFDVQFCIVEKWRIAEGQPCAVHAN